MSGALPFSITLLLIPLIVIMALDELPDFVPWIIPWVVLPLIPFIKIVETLFRKDVPNLDPSTPESKVFWHIAVIVCWAACYPFIVIFVLWAVCNIPTLILYERIVLLVFCGMLGRLTTIASHDLIHRRQLWARRLGEFMMSAVAMPHLYTEHVYMHHPNVATPQDKESARLGQSYYSYFLTVIPYAYTEAIRTQYRRPRSARSVFLAPIESGLAMDRHVGCVDRPRARYWRMAGASRVDICSSIRGVGDKSRRLHPTLRSATHSETERQVRKYPVASLVELFELLELPVFLYTTPLGSP